VLHGGSGIPSDTLKKAIRKGICKINLATEIKNIFMLSLQKNLQNNTEIDLRIVFPPAISAISGLVKNKLEIVRSGN
jgi:fructose-bisphosphate aldolase class II/tagatose 1,6-diphosphate aldolase GatY/KbaY